jgi:hypothetical protein
MVDEVCKTLMQEELYGTHGLGVLLTGLPRVGKTGIIDKLTHCVPEGFFDDVMWLEGSDKSFYGKFAHQASIIAGKRWKQMEQAEREKWKFLVIINDLTADAIDTTRPYRGNFSKVLSSNTGAVVVTTNLPAFDVKFEMTRWLSTVEEMMVRGLKPQLARELIENVLDQKLDHEWEEAQKMGKSIGWHVEGLLTATRLRRESVDEGYSYPWDALGPYVVLRYSTSSLQKRFSEYSSSVLENKSWVKPLVRALGPYDLFTPNTVGKILKISTEQAERRIAELARRGLVEVNDGKAQWHPLVHYVINSSLEEAPLHKRIARWMGLR